MNRLTALLFATALIVWMPACTTVQVADSAAAASALLTAKQDYRAAKEALLAELDNFPPEVGAELRDLQRSADLYVAELEHLWHTNPALSITSVDDIYHRGERLYAIGVGLIRPHKRNLSPQALAAVEQFAIGAQAVRTAYDNVKDGLGDYRDIVKAGMNAATLAIKLAAVL